MRLVVLALVLLASPVLHGQGAPAFSPEEIRKLAAHRLTHARAVDPSNAAMDNAVAIKLGEKLFFDARLAPQGAMSCATCHIPDTNYSSDRPRVVADTITRKVPSLYNAVFNRWFTWDGHVDSLWMQALAVFANSREFGATPASTSRLIRNDPALRAQFAQVFGSKLLEQAGSKSADVAADADQRIEVDVAKAIAAYVATLTTSDAPFDNFVDALSLGKAAAQLSPAAQRGARIFVGKGQCDLCHRGPFFNDGEFHNAGLPSPTGSADAGRVHGAAALLSSPYNLLGTFSDSKDPGTADKTRYLQGATPKRGAFKTPGLRNVAIAGPFMHDGRFATLQQVMQHYRGISRQASADRSIDPMLRLVALSDADVTDLLAFLDSLTAPVTTR